LTEEYAQAVRLDAQRRVALVSDSALVRGAITAINWFTKKHVVAFAPKDVSRALDWLAEDIRFDRKEADVTLGDIVEAVNPQRPMNGIQSA